MKYGDKILITLGKLFNLLQEIYFICSYLIWGDEINSEIGSEEFPKEHL